MFNFWGWADFRLGEELEDVIAMIFFHHNLKSKNGGGGGNGAHAVNGGGGHGCTYSQIDDIYNRATVIKCQVLRVVI